MLGALPTTVRGKLLRDSGLTLAAVALDARQQQRCVSRVVSTYEGSNAKELYDYPTPRALVSIVAAMVQALSGSEEIIC